VRFQFFGGNFNLKRTFNIFYITLLSICITPDDLTGISTESNVNFTPETRVERCSLIFQVAFSNLS
jgi:hypothetical protein